MLENTDATHMSLPESVTISAGRSEVYFEIVGREPSEEAVQVDAIAEGYVRPVEKMAVTVSPTTVRLEGLRTTVGLGGARNEFRVRVVDLGSPDAVENAATDILIDLAITNASPTGIVAGLFEANTGETPVAQTVVRAGNSLSSPIYVGTASAIGTYQIQATSPLFGSVPSPTVSVTGTTLEFSTTAPVIVGKGLATDANQICVIRKVDGEIRRDGELQVTLLNSSPSNMSVPSEITIQDGWGDACFRVVGIESTGDQPAYIDAAAPGYSGVRQMVNVVAPVIEIAEGDYWSGAAVNLERAVGGERDDFSLQIRTPGVNGYQEPIPDIAIQLEIVDAEPATIVSGFYRNATDDDILTEVNIGPNGYFDEWAYQGRRSQQAFIGEPTAPGSYRVKASVPALGISSTSSRVTVHAAKLGVSLETATIGQGLSARIEVFRPVDHRFDGALTVTLTSSDPNKVGVPASVTIPGGSEGTTFVVTGLGLTGDTPVAITTSASGYENAVSDVTVVLPTIEFWDMDLGRAPWSDRDGFRLCVGAPGSDVAQFVNSAITGVVSVVEAQPAGVIDGLFTSAGAPVTTVTLSAGAECTEWLYAGAPTGAGSYRIQVGAPGLPNVLSPLVVVAQPMLRFMEGELVVGKGLGTRRGWLEWAVNGYEVEGPEDEAAVSLTCDESIVCEASVSIGKWGASFFVEGVELGETQLTAAHNGAQLSSSLLVRVVQPNLWVGEYEGIVVGVTSLPDDSWSEDYTVNPVSVSLSAEPARCQFVGDGSTQVTIPAGESLSFSSAFLTYDDWYSGCTVFADAPGFLRGSYKRQQY